LRLNDNPIFNLYIGVSQELTRLLHGFTVTLFGGYISVQDYAPFSRWIQQHLSADKR